jgi:arylformamidase
MVSIDLRTGSGINKDMQMTVKIGKKTYSVDLASPLDISIPVSFGKKQLSAFGGDGAIRQPYKAGSFIGDVRHGGSCNCELYTFSPHLNGTHTEGVGHLTRERIPVPQVGLVSATLLTVSPKKNLITEVMLKGVKPTEALIIRTLPNATNKKVRNYNKTEPAYLAAEAMHRIVKLGVRHLLVDLPSVDKADDAHLTAHHIFWAKNAKKKTITELIYVPNSIKDGQYLLNLQVAAFEADAAPSRPVLYKVKPI